MWGFKSFFPQKISTDAYFWFLQRYMPASGFVKPFVGIISFSLKLVGAEDGTWRLTPDPCGFNSLIRKPKNKTPNAKSSVWCSFLVRRMGLEPTRAYAHYPLKVACLPFHHLRRWCVVSCDYHIIADYVWFVNTFFKNSLSAWPKDSHSFKTAVVKLHTHARLAHLY